VDGRTAWPWQQGPPYRKGHSGCSSDVTAGERSPKRECAALNDQRNRGATPFVPMNRTHHEDQPRRDTQPSTPESHPGRVGRNLHFCGGKPSGAALWATGRIPHHTPGDRAPASARGERTRSGSRLAPQGQFGSCQGGASDWWCSHPSYPRPDDGPFRVAEPVPFGQPSRYRYGSSPSGGGSSGGPGSHRASQRRDTAVFIASNSQGKTRNCIAVERR